jgi:GTP-binding protein Era
MAREPQNPTPNVTTGATPQAAEARGGRCALVGRPNAGKSTLLNTLLGQKLAIATPRPGTTRTCLLGVYASDNPPTQIAFIDTPGLHRPRSALGKVLQEQAELGLEGADVIVFLTELPLTERKRPGQDEGPRLSEADLAVLALIKEMGQPVILAVNKVDRIRDKSRLLPFLSMAQALHPFDAIVPISALRGANVDSLVREIRARLPEGLLYDDPEYLTDRPERFFAAEFVREAAIATTHDEVPHGVAVVIDRFTDDRGTAFIDATIIVEKPTHKGILIGAQGGKIKAIGTAARKELEAFLGRKVMLKLWVKVEPGWTDRPDHARRLATEGETP